MKAEDETLDHELRSAGQLELAGRLSEAAEIYGRLMSEHADNWQLLRPYARLLWNRQEHDRAFSLLDKAATLAPNQPELFIDRADYYFALGQITEAEESTRKALALAPDDPDFLVKLALVLLERMDREGARQACEKAIASVSGLKSAHQVLGDLAWQDGKFESAIEHLSIAREKPNPQSDVNAALGSSLFALGRTPEIAGLSEPPTEGQKYLETVLRAVFNWQNADFERCELLVGKAAQILPQCAGAPRVWHLHRLQHLLEELLGFLPGNEALYNAHAEAPLFAIGDNQVLSSAHLTLPYRGRLFRLRSVTVVGLRMADLVIPEANPQRAALTGILARLPAGADVLISAGSADLHFKDGILDRLRTNPDFELEGYLERLTADYLDRTTAWCAESELNPVFLIPPHTNVSMRKLGAADRGRFVAAVTSFAAIIRRQLSERGLSAIDLWAATVDEGGETRRDRFLDRNHVSPSTIAEAFRQVKI